MAYVNVDLRMIKHQIGAVYQELNGLRNQLEMLESSGEKDIRALEKLEVLGERIREKTWGISTKEVIDDIRG
ncbi:MAG: hypothetical protein A7316_04510 [Candidatus Altiarchaeales archaeon WOR_SM1_86-2]|nr:MAG: hypothetical protein A7316_04510 [Candidatus Altiarchaeales archaeon WOR_SM1_86-2]ODS37848.1 MAG: hypothetical protein A7315_03565 [Candidatus Altiarchaeales archaeon WOR_SM1_79]